MTRFGIYYTEEFCRAGRRNSDDTIAAEVTTYPQGPNSQIPAIH